MPGTVPDIIDSNERLARLLITNRQVDWKKFQRELGGQKEYKKCIKKGQVFRPVPGTRTISVFRLNYSTCNNCKKAGIEASKPDRSQHFVGIGVLIKNDLDINGLEIEPSTQNDRDEHAHILVSDDPGFILDDYEALPAEIRVALFKLEDCLSYFFDDSLNESEWNCPQ